MKTSELNRFVNSGLDRIRMEPGDRRSKGFLLGCMVMLDSNLENFNGMNAFDDFLFLIQSKGYILPSNDSEF